MDWIATIITGLMTGGVGATIGAIYSARKNAQVGMSGNEVEATKATTADWQAFTTYMQQQVDRLDLKIEKLTATNLSSEDYIDDLLTHINLGLGPPAPSRKTRKDSDG